jgi:hypothetical protein
MGAPIEPDYADYDFSETSQALLGDVLSAVSRVEQHLRKFLVHGDRDAALQQLLGDSLDAASQGITALGLQFGAVIVDTDGDEG